MVGGLLVSKLATKTFGLWPVTRFFRYPRTEAAYATLLMSTGLTFGSISALFGLTHQIIDQSRYSYLIATVIGSASCPRWPPTPSSCLDTSCRGQRRLRRRSVPQAVARGEREG